MKGRILLAVLLLAACKDKPVEPPVQKPSQPTGPTPTALWLKGELPPEVGQGTPVAGGTFTIRVFPEPAGLNRLHDQMADGTMLRYTVGPIYETLAEFDRDSHPRYPLKPLLAESWTDSADHL